MESRVCRNAGPFFIDKKELPIVSMTEEEREDGNV
jgi:hypothetical protein